MCPARTDMADEATVSQRLVTNQAIKLSKSPSTRGHPGMPPGFVSLYEIIKIKWNDDLFNPFCGCRQLLLHSSSKSAAENQTERQQVRFRKFAGLLFLLRVERFCLAKHCIGGGRGGGDLDTWGWSTANTSLSSNLLYLKADWALFMHFTFDKDSTMPTWFRGTGMKEARSDLEEWTEWPH